MELVGICRDGGGHFTYMGHREIPQPMGSNRFSEPFQGVFGWFPYINTHPHSRKVLVIAFAGCQCDDYMGGLSGTGKRAPELVPPHPITCKYYISSNTASLDVPVRGGGSPGGSMSNAIPMFIEPMRLFASSLSK